MKRETTSMDQAFIVKLKKLIDENLENEKFGVSELAAKIGFSRSQLHRKLQVINGKSTSQFIREHRLEHAIVMLNNNEATASEIAYRVGFSSPTYFNTCFHNYYGYPPGEAKHRNSIENSNKNPSLKLMSIIPIIIIIGLIIYNNGFNEERFNSSDIDKTIAVLPFVNDSPNEENDYFCNGIMAGIRDNLAQIPEFAVKSRLSVEKFRENTASLELIAKELNVNFFVEGRVQRIGDRAIISAELIHAKDNKVLWSENYDKDVTEIFEVQADVIKSISDKLETVLSSNLKTELKTAPTKDKSAFEYFLKGEEFRFKAYRPLQKTKEWIDLLNNAKLSYELAIKRDSLYIGAYIGLALTAFERYGNYVNDQNNLDQVLKQTNKVLQLNPNHSFAYIIRGDYFRTINKYNNAIEDYESSLKIRPNNTSALSSLTSIYYENNDYKNAVKALKKLEKYSTTRGDLLRLYNHYINFYRTLNQHNMVDYYFDKTFSLYTQPTFRRDRVYSYIQSKRYDKALAYINENLHKDNQQKNGLLGITYMYKEDYEKGEIHWEKCYNQVKKEGINSLASRIVYWGYGESLMRDGQIEKGKEMIQKQIEINLKLLNSKRNIDEPYTYYLLIHLYAISGDIEKVKEFISKFEKENGWLFWNLVTFAEIDVQKSFLNSNSSKEYKEALNEIIASIKKGKKQLETVQNQISPYLPTKPEEQTNFLD